ncbi:MAG: ankyrin repeat domain-containing protein [Planctomycetaceae bacterium]|nr:ankyrin repeat domain-containing protein [Planctomycetaceae bacterium]
MNQSDDVWKNYMKIRSLEELFEELLTHPSIETGKPLFIGEILMMALLHEDWNAAEVCLKRLIQIGSCIDNSFAYGAIIEYLDAWVGCKNQDCQIEITAKEPINGLKWLLTNGADMTLRMSFLPIHYATTNSLNVCLTELLTHGACPNWIDRFDDNNTPIMETIEFNNLEGVKILVQWGGANKEIVNTYGENIYDIASKNPNKEILSYLKSNIQEQSR